MKIGIGWQLSSYTGWGVYGINLALELVKRDIEWRSVSPVLQVFVDKLRGKLLEPGIRISNMQLPLPKDFTPLHALGNEAFPDSNAKIGVIFFEKPLSARAIDRLKRYEIVVAGSSWNEEVLRSHGLNNVRTIIQGVDRSIFHPAEPRGLYPGRFLIFSGGKAEHRKGQDIVVKAFRIFAKKHPEAMLVTAWHSPWPQLAKEMDLDLSEFADRVIDVGVVPNGQMAAIYRECDIGLFPNRAEGGTNLVAMEAIACGLPVILSACTGHMDLIDLAPARIVPAPYCEPSLDAVVEEMEEAFRWETPTGGDRLPSWGTVADKILQAVSEVT